MAVVSELQSLIANAETRANRLLIQAAEALNTAMTAVGEVSELGTLEGPDFVTPQAIDLSAISLIETPDLRGIAAEAGNLEFGDLPTAPTTTSPTFRNVGSAPTFSRTAPRIDAPTKPGSVQALNESFPELQPIGTTFSGVAPTAPTFDRITLNEPVRPAAIDSFQKVAPTINTLFPAPVKPDAFAGSLPALSDITMPAKPTRSTPAFNGSRPDDLPDAPDVQSAYTSGWSSASTAFKSAVDMAIDELIGKVAPLYPALEQKLQAFISGETQTGFAPVVEDAIYARSRAKQDAEAKRVADDAILRAARMGFTLPNGALVSSLNKSRQAASDNNAASSRDIVVMQAEMQQKNMQLALQLSSQLKQSVVQAAVSYHGNLIQLNGHAVQFASGVADSLVKTYQAAVSAFNARADLYKSDATVFETLVRASMAEIEVYKAEIQGELAKVQVDEGRVRLFQAQVEAHQTAVQTYSTQVQALVALSNLEKFKLEAFESEVRAYMAMVDASKAEWQAYSAAWSGEESKVRALLAQAQTYTAQVEGYKATVMADATKVDAAAKVNSATVQAYEARVRAYMAEVDANRAQWAGYTAAYAGEEAKMKAFATESQAYAAQVEAFRTQVLAATAEFEAGATAEKLTLQNYEAQVRAWGEKARALAAKVTALVQAEETVVHGYQVASQAAIQSAAAQAEKYRAEAAFNIESAKTAAMFSLDQAKVKTDTLKAIADTGVSAGQVYRGLAESSLSGLTTLVSVKEDVTQRG